MLMEPARAVVCPRVSSLVIERTSGAGIDAAGRVLLWDTAAPSEADWSPLPSAQNVRVEPALDGVVRLITTRCGVTRAGELRCAGAPPRLLSAPDEDLAIPANLGAVVALAPASDHACAVLARDPRPVVCWGQNHGGAAGQPSTIPYGTTRPVEVAGLGDAIDVVTTEYASCALRRDRSVTCWGGSNRDPETKMSGELQAYAPEPRLRGVPIRAIAALDDAVCALTPSGEVLCDRWHALPTPLTPAVRGDATELFTNGPFYAIRRRSGRVEIGGSQYAGDTSPPDDAPAVGRVPGLVTVAPRAFATCLLLGLPGRVRCRLGSTSAEHKKYWEHDLAPPSDRELGFSDVVELVAGSTFTCARRAAGSVVCWDAGDCRKTSCARELAPRPIAGVDDAIALYAGGYTGCAKHEGGAFTCWGRLAEQFFRSVSGFRRLLRM